MKKLSIEEQGDKIKLLLYGDPGSTKTRTAYSACLDKRMGRVLGLNAAGNPVSIRDYEVQPDILDMSNLKDFNVPFNWLHADQPKEHPLVEKFSLHPPYGTVVIDSITEVQRMSFESQRPQVGPGSFPEKVSRQHFYNTLGQMVNFARYFYGLDMHVIMTALLSQKVDDSTGAINYSPLLWGQSANEVGGYALAIGRMLHRARVKRSLLKAVEPAQGTDTEEVVSVAIWRPTGNYIAKDQYGVFGPLTVNPTIAKLLDLIEEGV